jgi:hypothetical protein
MDSTYILPIVISVGVLALFGVILWATSGFGLFNSGSGGSGSGGSGGSESGSDGSGSGSGGFTPLGDLHVCVSQINDWISAAGQTANAGPTGAHMAFYTALEGGIPSACSQLSIQLIDENGDSEIDFKWSNGAFYPSDVSKYKKMTGQDVLEFKVMDTMNCGGCTCSNSQPCPSGGLCVKGTCYVSQDFQVSQVVLNN